MPRFVSEVVIAPVGDELFVDGTQAAIVFRGKVATDVLPRLLPLIDGTRSMESLETCIPDVSGGQIRGIINSLAKIGLVDSGRMCYEEPQWNDDTLAFMRRFASFTGWASGVAAYNKLREGHVMICQYPRYPDIADHFRELLVRTGIVNTEVRSVVSLAGGQPLSATTARADIMVSVADSWDDWEWHSELERVSLDWNVPWMRAAIDGGRKSVDIGPFFMPLVTPCYRCFHDVHGRGNNRSDQPVGDGYLADEFLLSMVAVEVIYALSRIGPLSVRNGLRRYDLESWKAKDLACARLVGCKRCRPTRGTERDVLDDTNTALVYSDYVSLSSRMGFSPRELESSSQIGKALSRQTRQIIVGERRALRRVRFDMSCSVVEALCSAGGVNSNQLTVDQLAAILEMTAGVRCVNVHEDGDVRRWAATAGNLGSVELYVAVRNVTGLSAGIYAYQAYEHSLASLSWRSEGLGIDEFVARATLDDRVELPDVLIIFAAAFHRVVRKYGAFGYKLINLDAGAAVSQLQMVAAALSLSSKVARRWADDLIEREVRLDFPSEQSMLCVALSGRDRAHSARSAAGDMPRNIRTSPRDFFELSASEITLKLQEESRCSEETIRVEGIALPPELRPDDKSGTSVIAMAAPPYGDQSVNFTLMNRRSVRTYDEESVLLDQLSAMLWCAYRGDIRDYEDEYVQGNVLTFLILARRIAELGEGLYEYIFEGHGLIRKGNLPSDTQYVDLLVQSELANAPVQVWLVGDLAAAYRRHGAWGHRQLLLRAGAASHRLWFAALGTGLVGTIVAGLVPGAARLHLDLDGYRQLALCGVAVGRRPR
jgi:SagB-type dehydrogenase family enzyme